MNCNRKTITLGDACSRLSSGKGISSSNIHEAGRYPVYGGNGLRGYTDTPNFEGECAIIGRQGAFCGNVRYFQGTSYMTEHAVVAVATNSNNTRYLAYLLSTMNLGRLSGQSAQPGLSVKTLSKQVIELPSKEEQDKVVAILSALDDKIEINNRINENLQAQARALYKAWFVDYVPFNGIRPYSWKDGKLKDVLTLKRNAIKAGENTDLPYLPIDAIPMNTFALSDVKPNDEAQSSLITFDKDDIVIGAMRVYFHRVIIAPFAGITRTTCFTLTQSDKDYLCFGLLCCDQDSSIDYAQSTSKGSTMPYAVWDGGLGDMDIVIPDKDAAHEFNEVILPMIRVIQSSYEEIKHLRDLRDSLLPRLMSGELDVSEIDL